MPQVEYNGEVHTFPDDWTDEDIAEALAGPSASTPPASAMSRFVEGVKQNANPIAILSSIGNAVMHPMKTLEGLEQQSDKNFADAAQFWSEGDYGRAIHRGIAGAIPPYNIVTNAADAVREGNVAGGMGEAAGAVLAAKTPGIVGKAVPAAVRGANRAATAGATMLENHPALATATGAGVGYMQGGVPGAITGAMGGGLVPRLITALNRGDDIPAPAPAPWGQRPAPVAGSRTLGPEGAPAPPPLPGQRPAPVAGSRTYGPNEAPAPPPLPGQRPVPVQGTRELGPAVSPNDTRIPHGPATPAAAIDTRTLHGPAAPASAIDTRLAHGPASPASAIDTGVMHGPMPGVIQPAPISRQITAGARPMPAGPDSSYVRSIPAKYGEVMDPDAILPPVQQVSPGIVQKSAPPPSVASNLPKMSKSDIARITTLDKELGAVEAARTLRHDPRFAGMSAAERTAAIRAISKETPHSLPAAAAREIDAKFAAVEPVNRLSYVASWADVNPAVYHYLQQKLVGK